MQAIEIVKKEGKENTYLVTGWVEMEVFAEIKAKNIEELIKDLNQNGNYAFQDGNWASHIKELAIEEKNGKKFYKSLEEEVRKI